MAWISRSLCVHDITQQLIGIFFDITQRQYVCVYVDTKVGKKCFITIKRFQVYDEIDVSLSTCEGVLVIDNGSLLMYVIFVF